MSSQVLTICGYGSRDTFMAYWTHVSYVKAGLASVQIKAKNAAFLSMVNG